MIGAETIQFLTFQWGTHNPQFWGNSQLTWRVLLLLNTMVLNLLLPVRLWCLNLQPGGDLQFQQFLSPCRFRCIISLTCHLEQHLPQWALAWCRVVRSRRICPHITIVMCNSVSCMLNFTVKVVRSVSNGTSLWIYTRNIKKREVSICRSNLLGEMS